MIVRTLSLFEKFLHFSSWLSTSCLAVTAILALIDPRSIDYTKYLDGVVAAGVIGAYLFVVVET